VPTTPLPADILMECKAAGTSCKNG